MQDKKEEKQLLCDVQHQTAHREKLKTYGNDGSDRYLNIQFAMQST